MRRLLALVGLLTLGIACSSSAPAGGPEAESTPRGPIGKADADGSCKSLDAVACGGKAKSGSCWCDTGCRDYGDCCHDLDAVCGGGAPSDPFGYDMLSTVLDVDLAARTASARVRLDPKGGPSVSLEAKGLAIKSVKSPAGPLSFEVEAGTLKIELPASSAPAELVIDYGFEVRSSFDGLLAGGATFVWPYFCGNLFPCKSDPSDGLELSLNVKGAPAGQTVVYPKSIAADAPSYMLAWATGEYSYTALGTTTAGTKVGVYFLPGDDAVVGPATAPLTKGFDWLEKTLGPYTFGNEVASVSVAWGPGAYGGMEHHPFWHVGRDSMSDKTTHLHEAAHGWFGDGVRLKCWEDFVLSEGTVSYLTARAMAAAEGASAEQQVWTEYESRLKDAVSSRDHVAWPDSCNQVDILKDLFTSVPYMKGAFFYRAVAQKVGVHKLDQVIGKFYVTHVGKAASMQQMLDAIETDTGFDPDPLARSWLRELGIPPH